MSTPENPFGQVLVALVTPFTADGEVDWSDVEKHIEHLVTHGAHTWEIDEFDGANTGLVVAEIELDDPAQSFTRPPWLGEEVSHDARYYNVALAHKPYSEWKR